MPRGYRASVGGFHLHQPWWAHQQPNWRYNYLIYIGFFMTIYNPDSHLDSLFRLMLLDFSGQL